MTKLLLRVDDVGWLPPSKAKDVGLRYFSEWREALGSAGVPAYYGAIPTMIGHDELCWLQDNLSGGEELAVHGYSHASGEEVTASMMKSAASLFSQAAPCQTYIAPFNKYTVGTVKAWGEAWPDGYFLGGFAERSDGPRDHSLGIAPVSIGNTIHISAYRPLYDHTELLIDHLQQYLDDQRRAHTESPPIVVTLHATWDYNALGRLRAVMDLIHPYLVPIQSTRDWLKLAGS